MQRTNSSMLVMSTRCCIAALLLLCWVSVLLHLITSLLASKCEKCFYRISRKTPCFVLTVCLVTLCVVSATPLPGSPLWLSQSFFTPASGSSVTQLANAHCCSARCRNLFRSRCCIEFPHNRQSAGFCNWYPCPLASVRRWTLTKPFCDFWVWTFRRRTAWQSHWISHSDISHNGRNILIPFMQVASRPPDTGSQITDLAAGVTYPFSSIEKQCQRFWESDKVFLTITTPADKINMSSSQSGKLGRRLFPRYYALDMFPYPSGSGLHIGHCYGYTITDVMCRYKLMQGYNVLHPMGWDSFGLPAEQHALQTHTHPEDAVRCNIGQFRKQLQSMGFSYDWGRQIETSDPNFYRWTQWMFLKFLEQGLCYRADVGVNWCETLGSVLADDEVDLQNQVSVRGGFPVNVKGVKMKQWLLRLSRYAEELLDGVNYKLTDWPRKIREMQRNWIGRVAGYACQFRLECVHKGNDREILLKPHHGRSTAGFDLAAAKSSRLGTTSRYTPALYKSGGLKVFTKYPSLLRHCVGIVLPAEHSLAQNSEDTSVHYHGTESAASVLAGAVSSNSTPTRTPRAESTSLYCSPISDVNVYNPVTHQRLPLFRVVPVGATSSRGSKGSTENVSRISSDGTLAVLGKHISGNCHTVSTTLVEVFGGTDHLNDDAAFRDCGRMLVPSASHFRALTSRHSGSGECPSRLPVASDFRRMYIHWHQQLPSQEQLHSIQAPSLNCDSRRPFRLPLGFPNGVPTLRVNDSDMKSDFDGTVVREIRYRLKDWLFSRQRYWGEPIPVLLSHTLPDQFDNIRHATGRRSPLSSGTNSSSLRIDVSSPSQVIPMRNHALPVLLPKVLHIPVASGPFGPLSQLKRWLLPSAREVHESTAFSSHDGTIAASAGDIGNCTDAGTTHCSTGYCRGVDKTSSAAADVPQMRVGPAFVGLTGVHPSQSIIRRETNIMPQWAGSSWYFLRYLDPHNNSTFCNTEILSKWLPVDLYVGGQEHAVLHLLYARMWYKALRDVGALHVGADEPFRRLVTPGRILAPTRHVAYKILRVVSSLEGPTCNTVQGCEELGRSSQSCTDIVPPAGQANCTDRKKLFMDIVRSKLFASPWMLFNTTELYAEIRGIHLPSGLPVKEVDIHQSRLRRINPTQWRLRYKRHGINACDVSGNAPDNSLLQDLRSVAAMYGYSVPPSPFNFWVHRNEPSLSVHTYTGDKMSKSRDNAVSPDGIIKLLGADCLRVYLMSLGPLKDDKTWSLNGIKGVRNFLNNLWHLLVDDVPREFQNTTTESECQHRFVQPSARLRWTGVYGGPNGSPLVTEGQRMPCELELQKFRDRTNRLIVDVTRHIDSIESFHVAISLVMQFVNDIRNNWEIIPIRVLQVLLKLLHPFAPHVTQILHWILVDRHLRHRRSSDCDSIQPHSLETSVPCGTVKHSLCVLCEVQEDVPLSDQMWPRTLSTWEDLCRSG
eukprot:GHVQ01023783.1.p1 GENE.GHVQ01023783.1~~GHVQ01023783.1.p1  ORF type:complete len:1451 (+),score=57.28 GHVQ01023783.1:213-4565(+)